MGLLLREWFSTGDGLVKIYMAARGVSPKLHAEIYAIADPSFGVWLCSCTDPSYLAQHIRNDYPMPCPGVMTHPTHHAHRFETLARLALCAAQADCVFWTENE